MPFLYFCTLVFMLLSEKRAVAASSFLNCRVHACARVC